MNFTTELNGILKQAPENVYTAFTNEFLTFCAERPIILFGAGALGQITFKALEQVNICPVAFSDNNESRWGQNIGGIPVLSPADAVLQYGRNAVFVVTIYNPLEIINQLQQAGCEHVVGAATLWRAYPQMGTHGSFGTAAPIFEQAQDVRRAMEIFADEESQREYLAQLQWRTIPDFKAMPPHRSESELYFPPGITVSDKDIFVDCGTFDGDTLRMLLSNRENNFARFIGFEPDPHNFARLQGFIETLPSNVKSKIELHNVALGARNETVRFHATGTVGSEINDAGEIEMNCIRLDDALSYCNPSFIKMDIEGAELDALTGAREIIRRTQPVLAVCSYHETDHLWRIPQMIHDIAPNYQIYLRRYAEECWELVTYGVPAKQ